MTVLIKTMLEFLSLIWHCEVSYKREKYVTWLGSLCFVVGKWCRIWFCGEWGMEIWGDTDVGV